MQVDGAQLSQLVLYSLGGAQHRSHKSTHTDTQRDGSDSMTLITDVGAKNWYCWNVKFECLQISPSAKRNLFLLISDKPWYTTFEPLYRCQGIHVCMSSRVETKIWNTSILQTSSLQVHFTSILHTPKTLTGKDHSIEVIFNTLWNWIRITFLDFSWKIHFHCSTSRAITAWSLRVEMDPSGKFKV